VRFAARWRRRPDTPVRDPQSTLRHERGAGAGRTISRDRVARRLRRRRRRGGSLRASPAASRTDHGGVWRRVSCVSRIAPRRRAATVCEAVRHSRLASRPPRHRRRCRDADGLAGVHSAGDRRSAGGAAAGAGLPAARLVARRARLVLPVAGSSRVVRAPPGSRLA
jgi:hypothetical protein